MRLSAHTVSPADRMQRDRAPGFSILELLVVVAMILTIAAIAMPAYMKAVHRARAVKAIGDLKAIAVEIDLATANGLLPLDLAAIGMDGLRDPWGNAYVYVRLDGRRTRGRARKDKNLVPINSDYDLYSVGRDGITASALTSEPSWDDVVRGNDGGFYGLATDY